MARSLPKKHAVMADEVILSKDEKTFQFENQLPNLPIPTLQHTLERYLDSVRPFVTEEEFRYTQSLAEQFANEVGRELHDKLCRRAVHMRNWLEKWWEEVGYLQWREPGSLLNMTGLGPYVEDIWPPQDGTQLPRAAQMLHYAMQFWKILREESMRPHTDRHGNYLSMQQLYRLFSTCKIPGHFQDQLHFYFKTATEGECPSHCAIVCRGRWFSLECVAPDGSPLTPPELLQHFKTIRSICDSGPPGCGVGNLVADDRNSWAKSRSHLIALHPDNYESLEMIQKSIIVLALDDSSPPNENEVLHTSLFGDAANKWMDKSLNFIVYRNGYFGSSCDHAPFDAMAMILMTYYIHTRLLMTNGEWLGEKKVRKTQSPRELKFVVDDKILSCIQKGKETNTRLAKSLECRLFHYRGFGRNYIRSIRLHPDAVCQLSMQLAYYRLNGRPAPTYETATTRKFFHARTETLRSCTPEAVQWCQAMCDKNTSTKHRLNLLMKAHDRHNFLMEEACNNQGCDRHLFGMLMIAREEGTPLPALFTDPAFVKSGGGGNFILSTSSVGYTTVIGGVAPMCKDGYGSFYKMDTDGIDFFLASWTADKDTDTARYASMLQKSFDDLKALIDNGQHAPRL